MSESPVPRPPTVIDVGQGEQLPQTAGDGGPEAGQLPGLVRIGTMIQALLQEAREAPLDEAGRRRLSQIHRSAVDAVREALPEEMREELNQFAPPFAEETPSSSELRIAQAQLMGWLEGLFRGIQTAVFSQQVAAQQQLRELRRGTGPNQSGHYL